MAGPSAKNTQNIDSSQRNRGPVQVSMEVSNRSTENTISSEIQTLQKKITFLESENKELASQKDNLQETLGINK